MLQYLPWVLGRETSEGEYRGILLDIVFNNIDEGPVYFTGLDIPFRELIALELINLRASTLSGGEIRDLRAYYVNNSGSYIVV